MDKLAVLTSIATSKDKMCFNKAAIEKLVFTNQNW